MSPVKLMTKTERATVREALGQWHVPRRQIDAVLRHGVFGAGASGLLFEEIEAGVAIRVDETRDRELARLFQWRAALKDEEFIARWETDPAPHARTCCSARTRRRRSTPTRSACCAR